MVTLVRTVITGNGVVGGGVSTLAFSDPISDAAAVTMLGWVHDFWADIASEISTAVTFQVEGNPSRFAAADGSLQEVFDAATPAAVVGLGAGDAVPRSTQALIRWGTADIVANRVVKGRTFVPGCRVVEVTTTGAVEAALRTSLKAAADILISDSGGTLEVWHRPVSDGGDPPTYSGGSSHLVTTASVWDQWAVLRSRRD